MARKRPTKFMVYYKDKHGEWKKYGTYDNRPDASKALDLVMRKLALNGRAEIFTD